jgi:hypothetical protein
MRRTWFLLAAAPLVVWGCGDIIGLDGYSDGDSSVVTDATADVIGSDVVGKDVGNDVAPNDGGNEAGPTCNTQTSICVPDLPTGWAFTTYDPDNRNPCANGYGSPNDVQEGIDAGPAQCSCGCTTTNPDCHSGKLSIQAGFNNTCDNINTQTDVADAGCNTLTAFTTSNNNVAVIPPTPVGGSCTASPSQTIPAVGYAHQGRTCDYEAGAPGLGCGNGQVCIPSTGTAGACISQTGDVACPADAGYPTQHTIGTAVTDTRGCSACACTFDAGSCGGNLTLWTDTACSNNGTQIPATDTCTKASGNNRTWRGYSYVSQTTASCAGTPATPDGGVAFNSVTTVCCK